MGMRLGVLALMVTALAGCANTSTLSGDVYSSSQARTAQSVQFGTIVSVRPVRIQAESSGIVGGLGALLSVACWVALLVAVPVKISRLPVVRLPVRRSVSVSKTA